ncbi:MAG TPA: thermonuclease family protein [Nitrospirales bacterium]|jgi:endonuclease YncB( thermonuclease family)
MLWLAILFTSLLFLPLSALAQDFSGRVVGITEGDTITVLHDHSPIKVRLRGIDCPERGQPFGKAAKQAATAMAMGKVVTVNVRGRDKYGRTMAEVVLPDGRTLNEELVIQGLAWQHRKYSDDPRLALMEAEARGAKRGLWADPDPVPPWEWRKAAPTRGPHP